MATESIKFAAISSQKGHHILIFSQNLKEVFELGFVKINEITACKMRGRYRERNSKISFIRTLRNAPIIRVD